MANKVEIIINAIDNASRPIKSINDELGKLGGSIASSAVSGLQNIGKAALAIGAVGGVAAVAGIGLAIKSAVGDAAALEAQMSGVTAVTGASVDEAAALKDLVMELSVSPTLKVSAQEAADAIEMLGRNGLAVSDIMGGAAENVVLLSNATGGNFAQSADIATDVMALWRIETEDMAQAVDGITSVVNNSKFSIDDYALALAQGGGVAASVGVEFADFNSTIAAISPLFASGSDAGTSLKVMLQRLAPTSAAAQDAMADLGLITEDGANKFFDAAGNMRSMAEIASILTDHTADLSEQQKIQALSTIFGSDAMRAAAGLANVTDAEFRALQDTMSQTSAADNAAERINNLSGDMEIFKSVLGGLKLQVGDALLPLLRSLVQHGTDLMSVYGPAIVAGVEGVITSFSNFTAQIQNMGEPLTALHGLLFSLGLLFVSSDDGMRQLQVGTRDFVNALRAARDTLTALLEPVIAWMSKNVELKDVVIALGIAIAAAVAGPLASIVIAVAVAGAAFAGLVVVIAKVRQGWETHGEAIREHTIAIWNRIQEVVTTVVAVVQTVVTAALTIIRAFWQTHGDQIMAIASAAWKFIQNAVSTVVSAVREMVATFLATVRGYWAEHKDAIITIVTTLWTTAQGLFSNYLGIIEGIFTAWTALLEGDMSTLKTELLRIVGLMWENIKSLFRAAKTVIWTIIGETVQGIIDRFRGIDWGEVGRAVITGIANGISSGAGAVIGAAQNAAQAALDAAKSWLGIQSPSRVFRDEVGEPMARGMAEGMLAGAPMVRNAAQALARNATAAALADIGGPHDLLGSMMAAAATMRTGATADSTSSSTPRQRNIVLPTAPLERGGGTVNFTYNHFDRNGIDARRNSTMILRSLEGMV